jgi:hypothetical protein
MAGFLDQKFQVSLRDMLAASPEWRKVMREICTTKRVPTPAPTVGVLESFMAETWQRYGDEVVGAHSLPLRVVFPTFEGGQTAECILDQGAQVIAMRKDVWETLGLALNPDNVMVMESANSTRERTAGHIKDCRMTFGTITLTVQVQVVDKAPFEVLLGRPFFSLGECVTQDYKTGAQDITITDPNTNERVKIATKARKGIKPRTEDF